MGKVVQFFDRLTNVMSGMGTTVDKRTHSRYHFVPVDPVQVEASYRTSWLMRKIVDIPPLDMTREWRSWQADKDDIEKIEAEEKRLQLKAKVKRALVLARLWGGSAIIIGSDGEPTEELRPNASTLNYLYVVSKNQLSCGQVITDIADPYYGKPSYYEVGSGSERVFLHPSRVVEFIGQHAPDGGNLGANGFWGDPLFQSIAGAVSNADLAQDGFASLIDEAKIDIIKIPDMMMNMGTVEYEQKLMNRLAAAKMGKGIHRALIIDGNEEWDQRTVTWAGIPDIINTYLQIVSGAADIPVTRLLGQSPKGLQSTGDGEERDYHAMIAARQDEMLAPALDRIDEVMIRSALGDRPSDIWYKFNTLERLSPKDAAEIENKRADTVSKYSMTGLIEDTALSAIAKNAIIESGQWPGSEAAFEEADQDPGDEGDLLTEAERLAAKGGDPNLVGAGGPIGSGPPVQ